jgi:hypothetical protein
VYLYLFCNDKEGVPPRTANGLHEIRTGEALPINKNPCRVPNALRDEMKNQLDEMLRSYCRMQITVGSSCYIVAEETS